MIGNRRYYWMLLTGVTGVSLLITGCLIPAGTLEQAQAPGPSPGPNPQQSLNNRLPKASAGADQTVSAGQFVTLDGSSSSDPDHDQLSYLWTQVSGDPQLDIEAPFSAIAHVQAPADIAEPTTLVFSLTVSDGFAASAVQVRLTIQPRQAP